MLIITRKEDEEIVINSDIRIRILTASNNQVKIGISAPADVSIYRGELYEKIKENNIKASSAEQRKIESEKFKINKLKK